MPAEFLILTSELVDGRVEWIVHTQLAGCTMDYAQAEAQRIANVLHVPALVTGPTVSMLTPMMGEPVTVDGAGCPNDLLPGGPVCPRCEGERAPSGVGGGSWVHITRQEDQP